MSYGAFTDEGGQREVYLEAPVTPPRRVLLFDTLTDKDNRPMENNPFDSIESAHEFVRLLAAEVADVRKGIRDDITEASQGGAERQVDALQLVDFKLGQLAHHLAASSRVLNDLMMLRRLLVRDADASEEPEPEP